MEEIYTITDRKDTYPVHVLQVRPEDDRTGDPGRCAVSSGTKDAAGTGDPAVFTETYPMDP